MNKLSFMKISKTIYFLIESVIGECNLESFKIFMRVFYPKINFCKKLYSNFNTYFHKILLVYIIPI